MRSYIIILAAICLTILAACKKTDKNDTNTQQHVPITRLVEKRVTNSINNGTWNFTYNEHGYITKITYTTANSGNSTPFTQTYVFEYDEFNRIIQHQFKSGNSEQIQLADYVYNSKGFLEKVTAVFNGNTQSLSEYTWENNRLKSILPGGNRADKPSHVMNYNEEGNVTSLVYKTNGGTETIRYSDINHDDHSNYLNYIPGITIHQRMFLENLNPKAVSNNNITAYIYSNNGTNKDLTKFEHTYNDEGLLIKTVSGTGATQHFTYATN